MPAAAAAPAPPEDPPDDASACHGLRVRPCSGLSVVTRIENSGVVVRPITMAPAAFRLRTTGASSGAITLSNARTPFGVGTPATSTFCFTVTGTPWSGPRLSPRRNASSASRARARAASKQGYTMAFSAGLHDSTRARIASIASRAVHTRRFNASARLVALHCQMGPAGVFEGISRA